MPQYKIHIHDRSYTKWTYYLVNDLQEVELPDIHPATCKLMTNDIFIVEKGKPVIVHSTFRNQIPAVLILKDQKTYGRAKTASGKPGKLLYKCIPDDMRLPTFLVSYEMKNIGFSKVFQNQYVTINFVEWTDKHPQGVISQLIGPVDTLDNFYEYQLYCKSLNASIQKFNKDTSKALNAHHDSFIENTCIKYPEIEDRVGWQVITIDPPNSQDFDDGFGMRQLENGQTVLSIYIANVTIWLDVLKLWDSFSRRISTIYLPDKKRPMLPTYLSDWLCSLQSGSARFAFAMEIFLNDACEIQDIKYVNCKIRVTKNYCYEEKSLLENPLYKNIFDVSKRLSKNYKYIANIGDSHDVVAYLMIFMNHYSAKELLKNKSGIFRSVISKKETSLAVPENLPDEVSNFIKMWNSGAGQYIDVSNLEDGQLMSHDLLKMDAYIHITSPIRRIVDLLNIIKLQQNLGLIQLSDMAGAFYDKWLADLDYINTTMRSIRKVQNDCSLLSYCSETPGILDKEYNGYAFDKILRNDGLYQYIVYLPELRLTSRVIIQEDMENYAMNKYKMFLFHNEEKFKKKIRLQLVS